MRHILYFVFTSMVLLGCVNNEKPSTTDLPLPVVQLRPLDAPGSEHLDGEVEVKDDETAVFFLRRSFVHNDSVPTRGKDVRLIIHDGVITLRGVVESEQEKVNIHKLARQHGGQLRIENRLEIASSMDRVDDDPAVGPWFFQ